MARKRRSPQALARFPLGVLGVALALWACGGDRPGAPAGEQPHVAQDPNGATTPGDETSGSGDGEAAGGAAAGATDTPTGAVTTEDGGGPETGGATLGQTEQAGTVGVGEPLAWDSDIDCRIPPMAIVRPAACAAGAEYPDCKWGMPGTQDAQGMYSRWRNTIDEHTWGRPALVGVLLGTAYAFRQRFPNQELLIGDLDAPGPRHVTHKTGVDVDLYLPNTLMVENLGARRYRPNYRTMSNVNIEHARHRVEALARILAVCTEGRLRIYYNDTVVRDRFHAWFDERGYVTPFGRPMQRHNALHDFHFHVSIAEDTPLPAWLRPFAGEHPVREIDAPPAIEGVTVFAPPAPVGASTPAMAPAP